MTLEERAAGAVGALVMGQRDRGARGSIQRSIAAATVISGPSARRKRADRPE
jgi:hypothetical protein